MKYLSRFLRIIQNPKRYAAVFPYRFWGTLLIIKFYRKVVLPYLVRRTRNKDKINVIFLAMNTDMWRYDGVYRRLSSDPRYSPLIVTAMRNIPEIQQQLVEQAIMLDFFSKKGYNVIPGLDPETHRWIDLNKLMPDIIFYTQPYDKGIEKSLEYYNHLNSLICYTPYSFQLSETAWGWNNNLQQYCWKLFYVGNVHLQACKRLSRIGAENAAAVGYGLEEEYQECVMDIAESNRLWRHDTRKRIIWAPHHSISKDEVFRSSSFLEIAELMLQLRDEYKDRVIFAFKPHPVLKTKLEKIWGGDKAEAYYNDWAQSENSFYAQGDYVQLFAGSDAMIHCSGSFIVEYLYTGKPVAYVYSKMRKLPNIGPIGDAALQAHYSVNNETDMRQFIDNVVLGGNDTKFQIRQKVAKEYLKSPNGKMFSENVYESIVEGLRL